MVHRAVDDVGNQEKASAGRDSARRHNDSVDRLRAIIRHRIRFEDQGSNPWSARQDTTILVGMSILLAVFSFISFRVKI